MRLMQKTFYSLLLSLAIAPSAEAQLDFAVYGDGRVTPAATQLQADAGYGFLVYGERENENPFYGYVRPAVSLASSSTVTGNIFVDVYPVSFFGVTLGKSFNNRLADLPGLDCGLADCRDWLNYSYFQIRLLGKYKKFLGSLVFEKTFYDDNEEKAVPFADGTNVVFLAPIGEEGSRWQAIAGYGWSAEWAVGIYIWDFRTKITNEANDFQLLFLRRTFNEWNVTVGAGRFGSSQYGVGPQATLSFAWTLKEKIGP